MMLNLPVFILCSCIVKAMPSINTASDPPVVVVNNIIRLPLEKDKVRGSVYDEGASMVTYIVWSAIVAIMVLVFLKILLIGLKYIVPDLIILLAPIQMKFGTVYRVIRSDLIELFRGIPEFLRDIYRAFPAREAARDTARGTTEGLVAGACGNTEESRFVNCLSGDNVANSAFSRARDADISQNMPNPDHNVLDIPNSGTMDRTV